MQLWRVIIFSALLLLPGAALAQPTEVVLRLEIQTELAADQLSDEVEKFMQSGSDTGDGPITIGELVVDGVLVQITLSGSPGEGLIVTVS